MEFKDRKELFAAWNGFYVGRIVFDEIKWMEQKERKIVWKLNRCLGAHCFWFFFYVGVRVYEL